MSYCRLLFLANFVILSCSDRLPSLPEEQMTVRELPEKEAPNETQNEVLEESSSEMGCDDYTCPAARLSALNLPDTLESASDAGCELQSETNGIRLARLFNLLISDTTLNALVEPDSNGEISLILLNQIYGWRSDLSQNESAQLHSDFYIGIRESANVFAIDPLSVNNTAEPSELNINGDHYEALAPSFFIDLTIGGLLINLKLNQSAIKGRVEFDRIGFSLREGSIGGYISKDHILRILEKLVDDCITPDRSSICSTISAVLTGNAEQDFESIMNLLGGLDSVINPDGSILPCEDETNMCNALSVCLQIEMSSVRVSGLASPRGK